MEALFSSPLTMAAGAALVSAPIIIHLINRMRFRRIRWAAMEFLLKAQKRMRRKLILEQLILLLLRCLLVFLIAVLVSRFKWFSPLQNQDVRSTAHIVILDDTPSMGDTFGIGEQRSAFDQGKAVIWDKIAPAAAQSSTPQSMHILRLSELRRMRTPEEAQNVEEKLRNQPIPNPQTFNHLNSARVEDIKTFLGPLYPSSVRVNLVAGLQVAEELLANQVEPDAMKVVHVVTDLRALDWSEDGEALKEKIGGLTRSGVQVHLIDVSSPARRRTDRVPRASDNIAIVEFRPLTRVAARDQPVDFEVRVKNFGAAEVNNVQLKFYRNGKGNIITTREIASLPPGQERRETVQVQFSQAGTPQRPLDRYNVVTCGLGLAENGGIVADNVRHTVIEVEEKRKVLVIEGGRHPRGSPESDGFFLRKLFTGAYNWIQWEDGHIDDLETKDLRQYSCIFLLNVPEVPQSNKQPKGPEDYAPKKLEEYVREGGGLAVFLGPNVNPQRYNQTLYREGQGLFPVPLPDKFFHVTQDAALFQKRLEQRRNELTKWVLTRDPAVKAHPALAGLYTNERGLAVKDNEVEKFFPFVAIDGHWPIARLGGWTRDPNVRELYCLANERPISSYQAQAVDLVRKIEKELAKPKFQRYRSVLAENTREPGAPSLLRQIELVVAGFDPLTNKQEEVHVARLARYLDEVLRDQVTYGDNDEALLRAFWAEADPDLKSAVQQLRDQVKYGDPLYLVKQFGHGRVAAMLTTAGETWTDWPTGFGGASWVAVMAEMYKFLSAGRPVENRVTGAPLTATFNPGRARLAGPAEVSRFLITAPDATKSDKLGDIALTFTHLESQAVENRDGAMRLEFTDTRTPGVYLFAFPTLPKVRDGKLDSGGQVDGTDPGAETEVYECAAFAVNIDAEREGQLQRASYDDVVQQAPGVGDAKERIHSMDDSSWVDTLKQEKDDLSTRRWIYLLIVLVLIAEQAMAVRLSHHARAEDLEAHAPTAAAAYAHGTAPPTATAAAPAETAGAV